ncbi:MAG: cytochrome c3 family protein [Phycisphaerales bacterium]|nr:MAG: cytochrome c3 family protein [Phycisphaerales bacterium]
MMKWNKIPIVVLCLCVVMALPLLAAITGSSHDFSSRSWNSTGEICAPCHTPHDADISVAGAPLWNHELTTQIFNLYSSPTFNAGSSIGQPTGPSKLCLSCHDGTVALDNFGGFVGGTTAISPLLSLGTDLSSSHPISFTYDSALVANDKGLFDPATTASGLGDTIANDMLYQDNVECSSCHDVHSETGLAFLLVKSNAGSALCLTCHDK